MQLLEQDILTVLELFGFYPIKHYASGFKYSHSPNEKFSLQRYGYKWAHKSIIPFSWDFNIGRLVVDIQISEYQYDDSKLSIVDPMILKPIFFRRSTLKFLIIDLIDNRNRYYDIAFSYHILKIIKQYNIIIDKPLVLDENLIEMYVACKQANGEVWIKTTNLQPILTIIIF